MGLCSVGGRGSSAPNMARKSGDLGPKSTVSEWEIARRKYRREGGILAELT